MQTPRISLPAHPANEIRPPLPAHRPPLAQVPDRAPGSRRIHRRPPARLAARGSAWSILKQGLHPDRSIPRAMPHSVKHVLRLFVAGATTRSRGAVRQVQHLFAAELAGDWQLEVVDIYQQPRLARANQIVATPTLIQEFPRPVRRFIGRIANVARLPGRIGTLARIPR